LDTCIWFKLMVNQTRENLDKATSDLIASFVKFDQEKAKQLEIGLHALHNAQKDKNHKINLYAVCNYDMLHKLLAEHGISRSEFDKIPGLLASTEKENFTEISDPLKEALLNKADYNVPNAAMIAVMFNMVDDKVKNALIAGQAGERTLKAIERATTVSHLPLLKEMAFKDTLYDYGNNKNLARESIDHSQNNYLISAKATQHLADLLEMSLKLYPRALNFPSTAQSLSGFNQLAANIFYLSAQNLRKAKSDDAADKIHELAKHVESVSTINTTNLPAYESVANGMQIIREAMQADHVINDEESRDYEALVKKRIEQIKNMEWVG
jgi:hypothetical protein